MDYKKILVYTIAGIVIIYVAARYLNIGIANTALGWIQGIKSRLMGV
jgi:hypothetical protein